MTISFELLPPQVPNEIGIKMPVGRRQDGLKSTTIAVKDLTAEAAEEYAELMKQTFLKVWQGQQEKSSPIIPRPAWADLRQA
jgi:hypothetical protein